MAKDTVRAANPAGLPEPGLPPRQLAEAIKEQGLTEAAFSFVSEDGTRRRYAVTKRIKLLSRREPQLVYPFYGRVAGWLKSDNSFVRWDGIFTLANLACVDKENRFDRVFDDFFALLEGPVMISAANAAAVSRMFVTARPRLDGPVTARLLKVPRYVYLNKGRPSPECGYIVCGKALESFDRYFDISARKQDMLDFARRLVGCSRSSVAKRAAKFIKKHGRDSL